MLGFFITYLITITMDHLKGKVASKLFCLNSEKSCTDDSAMRMDLDDSNGVYNKVLCENP